MTKELGWKITLIIAVVAISIALLYPPKEKITLGLDLKGGMHLVFSVKTDEAVRIQTDNSVLRLKNLFKESSIKYDKAYRQDTNKIVVEGTVAASDDAIRNILDDNFREWESSFNATGFTLNLKLSEENDMKDQTVKQALETINNRVNEFGVTEPVIQREGDNRLMIELPGISDKEKRRVMGLINSTAMLEFKKMIDYGPFATEADALKKYNGVLPEDLVILKWAPSSDNNGYSVLQSASVITGRDLKSAKRSTGEYGRPVVAFSLNSAGANKFRTFTAANINQPLAIVLDNKILTAPTIQGVLSYDSVITGIPTQEEVDDLCLKLRSGALPAPLEPEHEQIIGPSLGADSIRKGILACIVGFAAVIAFMLIYYKGAGINSVIALTFNIVILFGVLGYFKATLTLPGIAGIILTIGMAVDANVLIFERIKEELKAGKIPKNAIDAGFKKAFVTILDSNITTLIAAMLLFQFGTSNIKGFAVTLSIGICASMFTAVFVSRVIFDLTYGKKKKLTEISI